MAIHTRVLVLHLLLLVPGLAAQTTGDVQEPWEREGASLQEPETPIESSNTLDILPPSASVVPPESAPVELSESVPVELSESASMGTSSGDLASTPGVAFVVYYTYTPTKSDGPKLPSWARYNHDKKKLETMIRLNFESARMTHPNCRLVILSDNITEFPIDHLTPKLPGPPIQVVRYQGLDTTEEMLSRLQTRVWFLEKETGSDHLIFLDTDMLVVKNMVHVFDKTFDLAATWRQEPRMPVNGGIIFVPNTKLHKGRGFFQAMIDLTKGFIGKSVEEGGKRRWYGQCDQVALATVMSPRHGYQGPTPGTEEAREQAASEVRTTYYPAEISGGEAEESSRAATGSGDGAYDIVLLGCTMYNGSIKREPAPWCEKKQCCCSEESHILHFKGNGKMYMESYWKEACNNPDAYKCAIIEEKCKKYSYGRSKSAR